MTQKDFLQNQGIEEILRERANHYSIRKRPRDFWVLISPNFLSSPSLMNQIKNSNFYFQKKNILASSILGKKNEFDFYAALVTLDKDFLNWMQVRLGAFEDLFDQQQIKTEKTKFDGIRGKFTPSLASYPNSIHPDILVHRNKELLELNYRLLNR